MAVLAGKLLKDMGFTNVRILKGGTVAWKDADCRPMYRLNWKLYSAELGRERSMALNMS